MIINYLAFAIPFFLFFIGLEYILAKFKGKNYFKFNDSIANLSIGIAERLTDMLTVGLFYFFYKYLHEHYAILDIEPNFLIWIFLFLATDFVWYWYHRLAHEINILWSVHIVHHQSEEFNYTVSTRITLFQAIVRTGFWSILPILGFPPDMIAVMLLIHGAYPFFTHTRLIGKLGILEYVFVTPSHHRVHHACNEQYIDKNYGDVLIIWDKLFGTFEKEVEEPVYGLSKPLKSYSFLWQYFHYIFEIIYTVRHTNGWRNKFKIIFGSPQLISAEARSKVEARFLSKANVQPTSARFRNYVTLQISSTLFLIFLLILLEYNIPLSLQYCLGGVLIVTLINCGAIMEQRTWVFYLEFIRTLFIITAIFIYFPNPSIIITTISFITIVVFYFVRIQNYYLRIIYS